MIFFLSSNVHERDPQQRLDLVRGKKVKRMKREEGMRVRIEQTEGGEK